MPKEKNTITIIKSDDWQSIEVNGTKIENHKLDVDDFSMGGFRCLKYKKLAGLQHLRNQSLYMQFVKTKIVTVVVILRQLNSSYTKTITGFG